MLKSSLNKINSDSFHQRIWLFRLLTVAFLFFVPMDAALGNRKPAAVVSIADYGAVADGTTLNTEAIQKAIDACAAKGGGTVNVPAGRFLTGTIILKSNITLHLDDNAVLLGSTDPKQYRNVDPFKDGLGADVGFAMVAAIDATKVGITGRGAIDGQGKALAANAPFKGEGWGYRPFLVRFVRCTDVTIRDAKFLYAAAWTTNLFQCRNVTIERLKIVSLGVPHNDGIDIDSCQGVVIKDCDIESGDDAICFKTTSSMPVKDVVVTGCRLKSNQGAIKFGTESVANFENVKISNCHIYNTRNGGIKLLSADGAHLRNITISDITMDNVATPIFVRLGARLKTFRPEDKKGVVGSISNVVIRNVRAKAAERAQIMPPSGIFITGIPGHPVGDLTLENIEIELAGGGERLHGRATLPENENGYPEINRFGKYLPAFGIFARHVKGLKVNGFSLKLAAADLRPALVVEDGEDLEFKNWKLPANTDAESLIRLEATRRASLSGFVLGGDASTFLRVEGKDSGLIKLGSNKLGSTKKVVELGESVAAKAVSQGR